MKIPIAIHKDWLADYRKRIDAQTKDARQLMREAFEINPDLRAQAKQAVVNVMQMEIIYDIYATIIKRTLQRYAITMDYEKVLKTNQKINALS